MHRAQGSGVRGQVSELLLAGSGPAEKFGTGCAHLSFSVSVAGRQCCVARQPCAMCQVVPVSQRSLRYPWPPHLGS